jgi:hypothetical protein
MTYSLEVETRNYWRAMRAIGAARTDSLQSPDMSDEVAELETIALHSQSPMLRTLCRNSIDRFYAELAAGTEAASQ